MSFRLLQLRRASPTASVLILLQQEVTKDKIGNVGLSSWTHNVDEGSLNMHVACRAMQQKLADRS